MRCVIEDTDHSQDGSARASLEDAREALEAEEAMKLIATRSQLRIGASLWVCAVVACTALSYPSMEQIAVTEPHSLFWKVVVSGNASAPFIAEFNWNGFLLVGLGPIALGWSVLELAALIGRRRYRSIA